MEFVPLRAVGCGEHPFHCTELVFSTGLLQKRLHGASNGHSRWMQPSQLCSCIFMTSLMSQTRSYY